MRRFSGRTMPTTWTLRCGECLVDRRGVRASASLTVPAQGGAAAERAGAAGEEVGLGRVGRERRGVERLRDAPGGERGEDDAGHAARVARCARRSRRGRGARRRATAACPRRCRACGPRGRGGRRRGRGCAAGRRGRRGGGRRPRRRRSGCCPPAARRRVSHSFSSPEPASRGSNGPASVERAAGEGEVRAPQELGVPVGRAEVERGDRQRLAPARAEARVLEDRDDRAASGVAVGVQQRGEPAGPDAHVVVEQADQVARRVRDARVAGDVDALRAAERDVAAAVALDELSRSAGPRPRPRRPRSPRRARRPAARRTQAPPRGSRGAGGSESRSTRGAP